MNLQVIVSSKDARLYLVDDSGIINEELEHMSHENFTSEAHTDREIPHRSRTPINELVGDNTDVQSLHTALNKARLEIEGLHTVLTECEAMLAELSNELELVRKELETSNHTGAVLRTEVGMLKQGLKFQTAKAKRFWTQKCEQSLAHEAALEQKDAIITNLQDDLHGGMKQGHTSEEQG